MKKQNGERERKASKQESLLVHLKTIIAMIFLNYWWLETQILIYLDSWIWFALEIIGESFNEEKKKAFLKCLTMKCYWKLLIPPNRKPIKKKKKKRKEKKKDKSLISNSCSQHLLFIPVINTSFSISDKNGYFPIWTHCALWNILSAWWLPLI